MSKEIINSGGKYKNIVTARSDKILISK